jgi:hypothetical protein
MPKAKKIAHRNLLQLVAFGLVSKVSFRLAEIFSRRTTFRSISIDAGFRASHRSQCRTVFLRPAKRFGKNLGAFRHCFSHDTIPALNREEDDLVYPLLTYERFWHGISLAVHPTVQFFRRQGAGFSEKRRFTIFPIYFQQRSPETNENYTALFPFYGISRTGCSR